MHPYYENGDNLDAATEEELTEISRTPCAVEYDVVREYASKRLGSMWARLDGNIEVALLFERDCENIYKMMPENLRW